MNRDDEIIDDVDEDVRKALAELKGEAVETPDDNDEADAGDDVVETPAEKDERIARDASGRFAKRGATKTDAEEEGDTELVTAGTKQAAGADLKAATSDDQRQPASTPAVAGGPPPGWSINSKAAWDALPEQVRADIIKREQEVNQGLAGLQDYNELKPFAELAKQHNTTIARALDGYVRMENVLRRDVGSGLALIAQNYGLNQQQAAQLFAGLAQKFGAPAPMQQPAPNGQQHEQGDPLQAMLAPILQPLVQQIGELKGSLTQREQLEQQRQMQTHAQAIEQFASDPANRYFTELEDTIVRLLESGMVPKTGNPLADLRAAYDTAARMNPEVSQALINQRLTAEAEAKRKKEQEAAARAKNASRSMSGSRVPGTIIREEQDNDDPDDVEADVRRAYRQLSMA